MEQAQMILDLWRMFLRRLWILLVIGVLGILASGFVAYVLPPVYEAEATILVESQQIPTELARSTVTASAAERLQLIEQRLMTRNNLLRLIENLQLFQDRPDLSISEKIDLLRESTEIRPIPLSGQRARRAADTEISAFTISVSFSDAGKATQIANEFVTTVLDQNLRARSARASETLEFFTKEEERLSTALADLESRITEFKKENERALPESLEYRRQEYARLTETGRLIQQKLLELEEKRGLLETELTRAATTGLPPQTPEEQQIRELEGMLAQKRAVYSDSHRDIRALKAQITALKAIMAAAPGSATEVATDPLEFQQASIRHQIDLIADQIELLNKQQTEIEERRTELATFIQQTPSIEMALNALYRRHTELQEQYGAIVRKRTEAETGEKLEVNQQAERFEVIENAIVPEEPVSPDRTKVVALGSAVSLALALGVAFLVEMLNPAIRSASQMERLLDLRPVVTIPQISTRSERRRRAMRILAFVLITCAGVPAILYAVDQYVMPLELIGARLAENAGLSEIIRTIEDRL